MPIPPTYADIDPELIDILIKKEREEQKEREEAHKQPFLQLPMPNLPQKPVNLPPKPEKNGNNNVIIIDL